MSLKPARIRAPDLLDREAPPVGPVRMLTYAEAAALLRIDVESVQRRAQRSGWARSPGNDGRVRVAVPEAVLPVDRGSKAAIDEAIGGIERGRGVDVLAATLAELYAQAKRERVRAERDRARYLAMCRLIEDEVFRLTKPGSAARKMSRHYVARRLRGMRQTAEAAARPLRGAEEEPGT